MFAFDPWARVSVARLKTRLLTVPPVTELVMSNGTAPRLAMTPS
jgi:hypothetical protein